MDFAATVWKAVRDVVYEFQAGPKAKKRPNVRLKRFPKLPKVRLKRESEPRRPRLKPDRKALKKKMNIPPKKIPPNLVKIIKRERAFIERSPM